MKRIGFIDGHRIAHWDDWQPSLAGHVYEQDDFLGDILKDEWGIFVSAGCTGALPAVAAMNGTVALTTVVTIDFFAQISHELNLNALHACGMEARIDVDELVNQQFMVGLCDALTYADGTPFDDYGIGAATPVVVAADSAAVIGIDQTISVPNHPHLNACSTIGGVSRAATDLGVDPVPGTFIRLGIQLDAPGNAYFYINGVLVATHLLAVTPATALTVFAATRNKAAGPAIGILTVDYIKFWQNR